MVEEVVPEIKDDIVEYSEPKEEELVLSFPDSKPDYREGKSTKPKTMKDFSLSTELQKSELLRVSPTKDSDLVDQSPVKQFSKSPSPSQQVTIEDLLGEANADTKTCGKTDNTSPNPSQPSSEPQEEKQEEKQPVSFLRGGLNLNQRKVLGPNVPEEKIKYQPNFME